MEIRQPEGPFWYSQNSSSASSFEAFKSISQLHIVRYTSILILFSCFRCLHTFKKRLLASSFVSVHPCGTIRLQLDGFCVKFHILRFLKTCREIIQVSLQSEKDKGSLHEDVRNPAETCRIINTNKLVVFVVLYPLLIKTYVNLYLCLGEFFSE